jgi:hypothetical protein
MANTLKILGQSLPVATVLTDLYTVPAATSTVVSSLIICNTGVASTTFRVAVRQAGASATTKQYLYYDALIAGNDTVVATLGLSLAATDVISVSNVAGTCSFSVYGQEKG